MAGALLAKETTTVATGGGGGGESEAHSVRTCSSKVQCDTAKSAQSSLPLLDAS